MRDEQERKQVKRLRLFFPVHSHARWMQYTHTHNINKKKAIKNTRELKKKKTFLIHELPGSMRRQTRRVFPSAKRTLWRKACANTNTLSYHVHANANVCASTISSLPLCYSAAPFFFKLLSKVSLIGLYLSFCAALKKGKEHRCVLDQQWIVALQQNYY